MTSQTVPAHIGTVPDILRVRARTRPHDTAVHYEGRQTTYAELDARSNRVAQALARAGVGAGDRVAFLSTNVPEYLDVLFGTTKLNAVIVPINWRLTPHEVALLVADVSPSVMVVGDGYESYPAAMGHSLPYDCHVIALNPESGNYLSFDDWVSACSFSDLGVTPSPDDLALLLYTSGTTGLPKGAMHTHAGVIALLDVFAELGRLSERSIVLSMVPMFHIGGTAWALAAMWAGGEVVILPTVDPERIVNTVRDLRVTYVVCAPAVIQRMLEVPGVHEMDFASWDMFHYGGSAIAPSVLKRAVDVFDCDFMQGLGMTECGIITSLPPSAHDPERHAELLRSCGQVVRGTELKIVDVASEKEAAVGDVGELWVRSPAVMKGYWRQPEATALTLTADGWLRTGDAARVDDAGWYFVEDRLKEMIVSGAENVYPTEVENVIMMHEAVAECAVIGVPDENWGEAVKAVIVMRDGRQVTDKALIAFCRERLAGYKCPKSIDRVASLPRTPSGKVVKNELRAPYWRGRPRLVS